MAPQNYLTNKKEKKQFFFCFQSLDSIFMIFMQQKR